MLFFNIRIRKWFFEINFEKSFLSISINYTMKISSKIPSIHLEIHISILVAGLSNAPIVAMAAAAATDGLSKHRLDESRKDTRQMMSWWIT